MDVMTWDDAVLLLTVAAVVLALSVVHVVHSLLPRRRDRLR
jgi:hypothetical protein